MNNPPRRSSRNGLTLIELTTVLVILSIMAGVIIVSLRSPLNNARHEGAIERAANTDSQARLHAARLGRPRWITFPLGKSHIEISDEKEEVSRINRIDLGRVKIGQVIIAGRPIHRSEASVEINASGGSMTYAIRLDAPSGEREWLLFAGITGQMRRLSEQKEVNDAFRQIATQRANAH